MRNLGYTTLLLTASLVVTPACNKKEETGDSAAKKTDGDGKVEDKKAGEAGGGSSVGGSAAGGSADGGLAGTATKLAAGAGASAISLIPDNAEFIMGMSVGSIMSSPFYKLAEAEMNKDPEVAKMLTMVKDCGLDPQKLESVVVGVAQDENFVLVMVGEGLGEDQKAKCLIDGVQKSAGEGAAGEVATTDGKKSIQFAKGRAYLVDGRTLALTTTGWDSTLVSLIDGKGSPAISNSKKDLFAKVNTNATMWGLAVIPPELAGMAPMFGAPAEFSSVQNVTGSLDLSSGAAINVLAGFNSEATAKSVAEQLQALLVVAGQEVPPEFAGVMKSLKIEAAGTDLKVALSATADELAKIQAAAPI
jgi:hypothetical protein